jgi:hypothetical protein
MEYFSIILLSLIISRLTSLIRKGIAKKKIKKPAFQRVDFSFAERGGLFDPSFDGSHEGFAVRTLLSFCSHPPQFNAIKKPELFSTGLYILRREGELNLLSNVAVYQYSIYFPFLMSYDLATKLSYAKNSSKPTIFQVRIYIFLLR